MGESSSAYFLWLERRNGTDHYISVLRDKDGLCDVFRSFYLDLFSAAPCDSVAHAELLSNISSVRPFRSSEVCKGLLSQEECFAALQDMAHGKAPGCDGLPMEFYLKFWLVLGFDLVRILNSALSFKKGDRLDPKNWHPISLLNVDYKIAFRSTAARRLKTIHLVVDKDQSCCVPGRFSGENVAFLRDVVDFCSSSGAPDALHSLDQEKAFDRVHWTFSLCMQWVLGSLLLGG